MGGPKCDQSDDKRADERGKDMVFGEGELDLLVEQFYRARGSVAARLDVNAVYDEDLERMLDNFLEVVWACEKLMRQHGHLEE